MIDNKTDGDEKASDVASADKTGAADSEHAPQRGKLGIRKSSGASPGQDSPAAQLNARDRACVAVSMVASSRLNVVRASVRLPRPMPDLHPGRAGVRGVA